MTCKVRKNEIMEALDMVGLKSVLLKSQDFLTRDETKARNRSDPANKTRTRYS